jgi:rfaE bifunctional protein kinase chain/domain
MLDRYLTGSVSRISPEAPVPVVLHGATEDRLGGAANVALNVQALGGVPILCSVIGLDEEGKALRHLLPGQGFTASGLVATNNRCTTVKTRVLASNQQMLRIDRENVHPLDVEEEQSLLETVEALLDEFPVRVVVFQDYNKGVLTPHVIESVLQMARERRMLTAVDPKRANFFAYREVDLFKPNLKEIRDSAPFEVRATAESLQLSAAFLQERLKNRLTMITLSEKGLYLDDGRNGRLYPTEPRNVADVSGAGDSVISIAALALAAGLDLGHIALLSNLAGGQVCEFPGVVPVRRELLAQELGEYLNPV